MTLLVTVFAAVICTVIWYKNAPHNEMMVGTLCFMYWGASIMWFVDAVFEYVAEGTNYFTPPFEDMINDMYLGLSAIAFGLVIWIIILLIKDPKGVVRSALIKKKQ